MGCNVVCPVLPFNYKKSDWGLDDPTGKPDEEFYKSHRRNWKKGAWFIRRSQGMGKLEFNNVSIQRPSYFGLWIYPMMLKIDFNSVKI